ncbi:MAG TPA: hypothetical protein VIT91_00230 [Chthoniobacterales bacterium]
MPLRTSGGGAWGINESATGREEASSRFCGTAKSATTFNAIGTNFRSADASGAVTGIGAAFFELEFIWQQAISVQQFMVCVSASAHSVRIAAAEAGSTPAPGMARQISRAVSKR